jgi:hypothetical protein
MATFQQKLLISLGSAALFALINLPQVYRLTNSVSPVSLYNQDTSCPTAAGLIIHAIIFFALTFLTMRNASADTGTKLKHSLYGTLIFFLIASPAMFSVVSSVLGNWVASPAGCPTLSGVLLHSLVYCMALVSVMYLP